MTRDDDDFENYYVPPGTTAPSPSASPEDAVPPVAHTEPGSGQPTTPWPRWALLAPEQTPTVVPVKVPPPQVMPARTVAILELVGVVLGVTLSWVAWWGSLVGLPILVVAFREALRTHRRTLATGEAGRGRAVGAIVISSIVFALAAFLLIVLCLLNWLMRDWA